MFQHILSSFPSNLLIDVDSIHAVSDRLYVCKTFDTISNKNIYILLVKDANSIFGLSEEEFDELCKYRKEYHDQSE